MLDQEGTFSLLGQYKHYKLHRVFQIEPLGNDKF
jgi:hypothetical protein